MQRVLAILNPQADRGRTARLADALRDMLSGQLDVDLMRTERQRQAVSLARDAGGEYEVVIAVGGDGTVHEVMNGLMQLPAEARPALGIVPAGSGNDVAYALGIEKDLPRAADMLRRGRAQAVDVGRIAGTADKDCYCLNNVGLLLEGEVNWASHRLRWPRGSGLYIRAMLRTLLRRLPAADLQLTIDGRQMARRAAILSFANGPRSGGRFQLMPDAEIDDGKFDYLLASPVGRLKLLWNVRHALAGKRLEGDWIERGRFTQMTVRSETPLVGHVDGEPWIAPGDAVHQISVSVLPAALRVICP